MSDELPFDPPSSDSDPLEEQTQSGQLDLEALALKILELFKRDLKQEKERIGLR